MEGKVLIGIEVRKEEVDKYHDNIFSEQYAIYVGDKKIGIVKRIRGRETYYNGWSVNVRGMSTCYYTKEGAISHVIERGACDNIAHLILEELDDSERSTSRVETSSIVGN